MEWPALSADRTMEPYGESGRGGIARAREREGDCCGRADGPGERDAFGSERTRNGIEQGQGIGVTGAAFTKMSADRTHPLTRHLPHFICWGFNPLLLEAAENPTRPYDAEDGIIKGKAQRENFGEPVHTGWTVQENSKISPKSNGLRVRHGIKTRV